MSFSLIYVTHPSKPEADRISMGLLCAKLVACANSFTSESLYNWNGAITREQEVTTIYKTATQNIAEVEKYIQENHKYEIPCIIRLALVTANASYEEWIQSVTGDIE